MEATSEYVIGESWFSGDGGRTWTRCRPGSVQVAGPALVTLEVSKVDKQAGEVTLRAVAQQGAPELDDERWLRG